MPPFRISLAAVLLLTSSPLLAGPLGLVLPTDNDKIFSDPTQFYMYTDRNFEGVRSKPWQGGTYGFSRNGKRTSVGIINTRFHEGIDIRPVRRDASGNPLDDIYSMMNGTVVYVNSDSTKSNYGRYVVVHHDFGNGPFFSLYAHISSATVAAGQQVRAGQTIAKMGYTGAGINRERSHVHVELTMLLSDRFQGWYDRHFTSKNHHGIYNGINMIGLDIASLLKAHRANPGLTMDQFLASQEVHYKVLVPGFEKSRLSPAVSFLRKKCEVRRFSQELGILFCRNRCSSGGRTKQEVALVSCRNLREKFRHRPFLRHERSSHGNRFDREADPERVTLHAADQRLVLVGNQWRNLERFRHAAEQKSDISYVAPEDSHLPLHFASD